VLQQKQQQASAQAAAAQKRCQACTAGVLVNRLAVWVDAAHLLRLDQCHHVNGIHDEPHFCTHHHHHRRAAAAAAAVGGLGDQGK